MVYHNHDRVEPKFFCFKMTGMPSSGMVMELAEKIIVCGGRNIGPILVVQNRVNNFPIRQGQLDRGKTKTT
jgi:hypothetical protein